MSEPWKRRVEIGPHVLFEGDALEVLPTLGPVDVLLSDPPYGIGFEYASYDDTRDNLRRLIAGIFSNRAAFEKIIVLCGPTQIHEYPPCDWVGNITWNTTGSFGKFGYSQWTPVLLYGKDIEGFGNVNGVTKADTLHISGGGSVGFQRDKADKKHSCPKPLNIMTWTVARFTRPGELILDPFCGSGTTGVACVREGRRFVGIELDPGYFDIACERIEREMRQPRLDLPAPPKPEQETMQL